LLSHGIFPWFWQRLVSVCRSWGELAVAWVFCSSSTSAMTDSLGWLDVALEGGGLMTVPCADGLPEQSLGVLWKCAWCSTRTRLEWEAMVDSFFEIPHPVQEVDCLAA
jgi:hypothetical protein